MVENWKQWIKRAKSNLRMAKVAKHEEILNEDLCFECQQCAEKALKALLDYLNEEIPKIHSFHILLELIEKHITIPKEIEEVFILSEYAVHTRYPGDFEPIGKEEYERAVAIAGKVLNWVSELVKE